MMKYGGGMIHSIKMLKCEEGHSQSFSVNCLTVEKCNHSDIFTEVVLGWSFYMQYWKWLNRGDRGEWFCLTTANIHFSTMKGLQCPYSSGSIFVIISYYWRHASGSWFLPPPLWSNLAFRMGHFRSNHCAWPYLHLNHFNFKKSFQSMLSRHIITKMEINWRLFWQHWYETYVVRKLWYSAGMRTDLNS